MDLFVLNCLSYLLIKIKNIEFSLNLLKIFLKIKIIYNLINNLKYDILKLIIT